MHEMTQPPDLMPKLVLDRILVRSLLEIKVYYYLHTNWIISLKIVNNNIVVFIMPFRYIWTTVAALVRFMAIWFARIMKPNKLYMFVGRQTHIHIHICASASATCFQKGKNNIKTCRRCYLIRFHSKVRLRIHAPYQELDVQIKKTNFHSLSAC